MSIKNTPSFPPQSYFLLIFVFLLTACTPALTEQTPTPTIASSTTLVQIPTATLIALPVSPVPSASPIATPSRTPVPSLTPLPDTLPVFPLDGYVMLFTKDGDLYFQDGENEPVKLTYIGERNSYPYPPKLSDDNQKVVFSRENGNIYSINTDGTQERIIIPNDWLNIFDAGTKMGFLNFVSDTHLVLFETFLFQEAERAVLCSTSIFLADIDTGEIRKLTDLGLAQLAKQEVHYSSNIKISPNGKMLAAGTIDGIKILTLDGKVVRQSILPYTPSSKLYPPFLPTLSWLPDSKGLIIAIPDTTYNTSAHGELTAHTVWRYMIDNDSTNQIPLAPSPWMSRWQISPDGNRIAYGGYSDTSLYLGNLINGNVQIFGDTNLQLSFSWSPNSQHLIVGWGVITSFEKPQIPGGQSPRWMDANHYVHIDSPSNNPNIQETRVLIAKINGDEISYYGLGIPPQVFWLMKLKE